MMFEMFFKVSFKPPVPSESSNEPLASVMAQVMPGTMDGIPPPTALIPGEVERFFAVRTTAEDG